MINWYETEVGKQILSKKYFHDGECFNDFVNRVSGIFSKELQEPMKQALIKADFFPAGRSLYAAGSKGKFKASMSNCYIMESPKDNIESIYEVLRKAARISSYGGGVGINISNLRPNGAKVSNSAKTSSGSVSFLNLFNASGEVIGTNGRRNAMMLGLNCTHPDIEDFLTIKQNNTAIQSANLSILFTDEFMKAVETNSDFELYFKVEATGEEIRKTINAKDFFMKFCESQYDFAEPGALYIDSIRNYNILSGYPESEYKIDICNPCAEYTGSAGNACNLGSINLYNMVKNPFTKEASFDVVKFKKTVELGVKALDEILDYGLDMQPLEENKRAVAEWRAIGLGIFGLADMFIALGVEYGNEESVELVKNIMFLMLSTALRTSCNLARKKGTFDKYNWDYIKKSPLIKMYQDTDLYNDIMDYGLRNGSLLSIAPTGSIATMCGLSTGVEPLYAISFDRTTHALEKTGKTFKVFAKSVEDYCDVNGRSATMDEDLGVLPKYIVTSHDIKPENRVKLQAAMQKYVDNAISSTLNLKHEATVEDIYNAYMLAWKNRCKGLTVFRDGCARTSILGKEETKQEDGIKFDSIKPAKRSDVKKLSGYTIVKSTACVPKMYITINIKDGNIFEVFTAASTGCKSNIGNITRLASLNLRSGVRVEQVVNELRENQCPACTVLRKQGQEVSLSCGNAIAEALEEIYKELKGGTEKESNLSECPECGKKTLIPTGKCVTCTQCGYSKCD